MKHSVSKKVFDRASKLAKSPRKQKMTPENFVSGFIDDYSGRIVSGWMYSPVHDVVPVLLVDGRPASLIDWPSPRQDVKEQLGITADAGFAFSVPYMRSGANVELFALAGQSLYPVIKQCSPVSVLESNPLIQLTNAREISEQPGAVAVVCWDGAHNPIGRAKVLFDIVGTQRPVVLFAYLFEEFGNDVWAPLHDSDVSIVTIPWEKRETYHRLIQQIGIKFKTVWLCKPRLPTFLLGSQVADADARLILDLDDNEEYFSLSDDAKNKIYGLAGLGLSKSLTKKIAARTVASRTLQSEFGGSMVRHARSSHPHADPRKVHKGAINVGFVGTVRPHKNMLSAAKAIRLFNWITKRDISFHVYGDVQPPSLRQELLDHGVLLSDLISSRKLRTVLGTMDVVLTSFPSLATIDDEITKYQITSKIGDALCVGRPVLVPNGPSVSDLEGIPGVFLFDLIDFGTKLTRALNYRHEISLPEEFTFEGAYRGFEKAEREAHKLPKAGEVFGYLNDSYQDKVDSELKPALLLIWKQHDTAMYGRRIDQIARSYKRANPNHDVVVLELLHGDAELAYRDESKNAMSEAVHILRYSDLKEFAGMTDADGIEYNMIKFNSSDDINNLVLDFLSRKSLLHFNTVTIFFPFINFLEEFYDIFSPYKKIVDVVDNPFSWNSSAMQTNFAIQYSQLAGIADHIVFNSSVNKGFFVQAGVISNCATTVSVIPNWYELPTGATEAMNLANSGDSFDIIYSGNMNDRVDWQLLEAISGMSDRICLHLIGTAERAGETFYKLLQKPNVIYHGPQTEGAVLRLLSMSNLAIVPHSADEVSNFMNPIKLHMYKAANVPTVATKIEGIEATEMLDVCESHSDFLEAVRSHLRLWEDHPEDRSRKLKVSMDRPRNAQSYIDLIQNTRND